MAVDKLKKAATGDNVLDRSAMDEHYRIYKQDAPPLFNLALEC